MNDMLCLYIGGPHRLVRIIQGPLWTNTYSHDNLTEVGHWSMPERYHWVGQPMLGTWNEDSGS